MAPDAAGWPEDFSTQTVDNLVVEVGIRPVGWAVAVTAQKMTIRRLPMVGEPPLVQWLRPTYLIGYQRR